MTSRKPPNKPQERAAYLEACLKRMFKQFAKNPSLIDSSVKNNDNDNNGVDVTEMAENLLSRRVSLVPIGSRDSNETYVILSQGQYTNIFPHPHVFLRCSICDKICPSNMPKDQMMILFNSPSSLFPLCGECSMSFGKKISPK